MLSPVCCRTCRDGVYGSSRTADMDDNTEPLDAERIRLLAVGAYESVPPLMTDGGLEVIAGGEVALFASIIGGGS